MNPVNFDPSRTALIVVDMLVDFFDPDIWPESDLPPMREALCGRINACVRRFRAAGSPVIWVKQAFEPDLSDAFPHMRRTGKAYTIRGTPGAELLPELTFARDDPVIFKKRFSAFFGTGLADRLTELNIETVVLCGVTTSWCIRSTATDAYQNGFEVLLAGDCMAGFKKTDHERDLRAMDGYIAKVIEAGRIPGLQD
jgi:nicotinamidase-related amidase